MARIAITGAAGAVGTVLRPELLKLGYELTVTDLRPIANLDPSEAFLRADILDHDSLVAAFEGCEAIIHLAACTDAHADWPQQVSLSIVGTNNVLEAARVVGIKRVIYASSHHAVGLHPRNPPIDDRVTLRPDSRYGVGKAYGEVVGSYFAYKYDMRVLAIRIGNVNTKPIDRRRLGSWLSARDLAQLVSIGIEKDGFVFQVVYGNSDGSGRNYDNDAAYRLGYKPMDSSEGHDDRVLREDPLPEAGSVKACLASEVSIGGAFSDHEFVGDVDRLYG
ncbi:NAD-dependent epimerase/dehydratase family protein [Brucella intermedia]|uniref:NAD-dependent epimerase/dehydratase family protein n=1 Tax=Brucella intermedia TaxID=94625 RepID=UPI00224B7893|nr:NAD(P)-dependent oxidoreductase [Brucella intermedia]